MTEKEIHSLRTNGPLDQECQYKLDEWSHICDCVLVVFRYLVTVAETSDNLELSFTLLRSTIVVKVCGKFCFHQFVSKTCDISAITDRTLVSQTPKEVFN